MRNLILFGLLLQLLFIISTLASSHYEGPVYDSSAYTECKSLPEEPLYNGGMLRDHEAKFEHVVLESGDRVNSLSFPQQNLFEPAKYSFSIWIKIEKEESALIQASLETEAATLPCIGTVIAKRGCWSFLKGGFELSSPSKSATIYLQNSDGRDVKISIASVSLQPFTEQQWRLNQETKIKEARKRAVIIHVSDSNGIKLPGTKITVKQISKDFPFGSAIASSIIGNSRYQKWFMKRFNTAVFENELKWDATEPEPGLVNYTIPDKMLQFVRANKLTARGHNIFWENPNNAPKWVLNLTGTDLNSAVESRFSSLMNKYKREFMHWDVDNEMLHFNFFKQNLSTDAPTRFFNMAHQADPFATLFVNEYNVVESCTDTSSTVDAYVETMRKLETDGLKMGGIGLQGHFGAPNSPLMRAVLDKLATLGLPIWLTEVDISKSVCEPEKAIYLEQVLREGFSHPAVDGIMLWSALRSSSCYRMCLTDDDFNNLPTGDVVDKLLKEWETGKLNGQSDERGSYSFLGFLGEYEVTAKHGDKTVKSSFTLSRSREAKHFHIHL